MGRLTKLRGSQTRASEAFNPTSDDQLATDKEVNERVLKHSSQFHHNRNDRTEFLFDIDGNLSEIKVYNADKTSLYQRTIFTFVNGEITSMLKTVYNEDGSVYTSLQKDFVFGTENIEAIVNTKL
jgi:hypothetical protein